MKTSSLKKQSGSAMFLTAFFTFGMLLAIGLALDTAHTIRVNEKLQHGVDLATLSGGVVLNTSAGRGNTGLAITEANKTFQAFLDAPGNGELKAEINLADMAYTFSAYLTPFTSANITATRPAAFIRGAYQAIPYKVNNFLIQMLPGVGATTNITATATAGIIGTNCEVVPFVLCASYDPNLDTNCSNDTIGGTGGSGNPDCYGYEIHQQLNLVPACWKGNEPSCTDPTNGLGAGNYQLIDVGLTPGGRTIRDALSGNLVDACAIGPTITTKPGYTWGNVKQGILTRYGQDNVQTEYHLGTDVAPAIPRYQNKILEPTYVSDGPRVMFTPIADCRLATAGKTDIIYLGTACLLLTNKNLGSGSTKQVNAEFFTFCNQQGNINASNPTISGPAKVVLYKTEGSPDS